MEIQSFAPSASIFQTSSTTESTSSSGFSDILESALNDLNDQQLYADELTDELVLGGDVEIHEVMLATEEAKLSLQLAVQVRNKITEAIDELTNLQL